MKMVRGVIRGRRRGSIGWKQALKYALTWRFRRRRLAWGIPAFGYDWDLTDHAKSGQISWVQVALLLGKTRAVSEWDAASSSPHFTYTRDGHKHVVWYEDARSLGLTAKLVARYMMWGEFLVYALGMEDDSFWEAVRSGFYGNSAK